MLAAPLRTSATRVIQRLAVPSSRSLTALASSPHVRQYPSSRSPRSSYNITQRRAASFAVPNAGIDSVPSPGEATGVAAVDGSKGKVWDNVDEAVKDVKSGDVLLSAGKSICLIK